MIRLDLKLRYGFVYKHVTLAALDHMALDNNLVPPHDIVWNSPGVKSEHMSGDI